MPFQAVAWAWQQPVHDPLERCVLIWFANRAGPDYALATLDVADLTTFCASTERDCRAAMESLEAQRLLFFTHDDDGVDYYVPFPTIVDERGNEVCNRAPLSAEVRAAVLQAFKFRCFSCGSRDDLEVDHIIPRSRGGSNARSNLQALCGVCNCRKSNRCGWVQHV